MYPHLISKLRGKEWYNVVSHCVLVCVFCGVNLATFLLKASNHLIRFLGVFQYIALVVWILKAQGDDFANLAVVDGLLGTVNVLVSLVAESAETICVS